MKEQFIEWSIPDPKNMPFEEVRKIRNLIEEKTKNLLSVLCV